ncbi:MAG TPA: hypothetical protein VG710_02165, partial [Opitutus sp.]|nr:hypothetical protein [Opitutus sp.]
TTRSGIPTAQVEITENGFSSSVTGFDGLTTATTYDGLLRPSTVTDTRDNTTTTAYYAGTTMVETVTDAAGDQSATAYDAAGRVKWNRDARNHYTRFAYNTRGQTIQQWGDGSFPVSYGYDATYGDKTTMSTYRGGTGFDAEDWPASPGDADTTTWTYDEATGVLWKKTDAPTTEHPSGKTVTTTYNSRLQVATRTLARGVVTTYGYDSATGELLSQTYSDDTAPVGYTYGRTGQVETVSDDTGIRDLVYDPAKPWRLTAEAEDAFYGRRVLTRLYDNDTIKGRVTGFQLGPTAGSGAELEQTFGFTTVGRFESITTKRDANTSSRTFRYTYRTDSALIAALTIDGNSSFGVARDYEDHRDLVTSLDTTWGETSVSRYDYAYNELAQRTSTLQSGAAFADYGDSTFHLYTYDGRGGAKPKGSCHDS